VSNDKKSFPLIKTLPNDLVRQIMWGFADRYDLQMLIQSARSVARSVVARLTADGLRNTHEWNERKAEMLKAFDESGLTASFMEPEDGGFIEGPKNLAMSLVAYELSWVDAGAATTSMANNLALAPIHEKGTPEQKHHYMSLCVPPQPGENRKTWRGSFILTEPIPYVGADTGMVSGKVRVAEWKDGSEPILEVNKRGRFITNMGYSNFVTAAVDTSDERISSSCMVIIEETDPGTFDRGTPTKKMVHQLSSTSDPIISVKIPANRIIGGYTIKDGKIIPNFSHSEVIESVFARTRITAGVMTSAKILSAVEPVIRFQRNRFRGAAGIAPGSPRYDLGLQQREDALHRLVDVWAAGEAATSLAFTTSSIFDEFDPIEKEKDKFFEEAGLRGRDRLKSLTKAKPQAIELVRQYALPEPERDAEKIAQLESDLLVRFLVKEAEANVICPVCKLWNTGVGTNMLREAVSLMGGYGITEDCPGFIGMKWMDAQLEATYEGPEAVQRRQLSITMQNEIFIETLKSWILEFKRTSAEKKECGAGIIANAMELWLWTFQYLQKTKDSNGKILYSPNRQGVSFPVADALSWLVTSRCQILDAIRLDRNGRDNSELAEGIDGFVQFFYDLASTLAIRSAGEAVRIASELVFGFVEPQASLLSEFESLRRNVDKAIAGARNAKDRAAFAASQVMIPEALDYPI